jgi:hypothetical protein
MSITEEQKSTFLEQGYLLLTDVIPESYLNDVVDELNEEIDRRAVKLVKKGELSELYAEEGFETRLAKISQETPKLAVSIWNGVLHGPAIFKLISCPQLLDVAESIVGPEVIASSVYRLRPKIPNFGYGEVPWHQDSSYFEPYCDEALVVTMWVPLVHTHKDNGCLWVIPGSHKGKVVDHILHESGKYLEIPPENLTDGPWVCCEVPKGGVLLLTNKVMHASFKNSTNGVRWSMDLRYQSAALPTNAPITRLPDEITENIEAGVPAACYPPEADFLVRSRKRPEEVIRTPEQFYALRANHKPMEVTNRYGVRWKAAEATGLDD